MIIEIYVEHTVENVHILMRAKMLIFSLGHAILLI